MSLITILKALKNIIAKLQRYIETRLVKSINAVDKAHQQYAVNTRKAHASLDVASRVETKKVGKLKQALADKLTELQNV